MDTAQRVDEKFERKLTQAKPQLLNRNGYNENKRLNYTPKPRVKIIG